MKLDEIANDVGLDVNGDALLARGEQLVKLEVRHPMDQSDINASILSTRIANANVSMRPRCLHLSCDLLNSLVTQPTAGNRKLPFHDNFKIPTGIVISEF